MWLVRASNDAFTALNKLPVLYRSRFYWLARLHYLYLSLTPFRHLRIIYLDEKPPIYGFISEVYGPLCPVCALRYLFASNTSYMQEVKDGTDDTGIDIHHEKYVVLYEQTCVTHLVEHKITELRCVKCMEVVCQMT